MLVEPGIAIGPVRLGMTREEVASTLGTKPVAFERLGTPNDEFSEAGLQCEYDAD